MGRSGLELMINFKLLIVQVLHWLSFVKLLGLTFFVGVGNTVCGIEI